MRSVPAAQSRLQNVSMRSHGEAISAATPVTASVVTAVPGPSQSPAVAVGSGRRAIVLAVCCSALFMVGLDNTIVNVGLPQIGKSLHTSVAGLQWTVAGYTIVLASLLLFSGAAADRIGRRTIFQVGLSLFTLGSWLCSLAPSLSWLIAFRVLQGVGGSMLNPAALGIITNVFSAPKERAKAIGVWDGVSGLSMALGPVAGGILVGSVGWRGIFWANIPVGLAAISLTALLVPDSKADRGRKADPLGQVLVIVMLASLAYAIIQGPSGGWFSPDILGFFLLSLTALGLLLRYEPRRAEPISGRIVARGGPRVPFVIAGAALTLSTAALSQLSSTSGPLFLIVTYGLFGFGAGMVNVPISNGVMAGVPKSQAGVASGMNSSSRQLGQSLGVAIVGSVLAASLRGAMPAGFLDAAHAGWWIMAGCGYTVLILGVVSTTSWAKSTVRSE